MHTTIISGSSRANSNSLKMSRHLASKLQAMGHVDVSVVSMEHADIPLVGRGGINQEALTDFQSVLVGEWDKADLVIFCVPEYNWTTSGEFLNALHQLGGKAFAHLFNGKTFAIAGISAGRGGRTPAIEVTTVLNKLISFLFQYSVVSPKILEAHEVQNNLSEEGESVGVPAFDKAVEQFLEYSMKVAQKWS